MSVASVLQRNPTKLAVLESSSITRPKDLDGKTYAGFGLPYEEPQIKTVVINGRISSRSYPRYKLARPFFKHVLAHVDRFCMQSEEAARRIVAIGADPARVIVTGSLKFDALDEAPLPGRGPTRPGAPPHGPRAERRPGRRRGSARDSSTE